jgi:hypothetical protein
MTVIPFELRTLPFVTDRGVLVPARRPYVAAGYPTPNGSKVPYPTFVDTGAAYSVIPYSLSQQTTYRPLGARVMLSGQARAMDWHGIPCEFGELEVELIDTAVSVRTPTVHVLAKMPSQPASPPLERAAIFGMSFMSDNCLHQELDASGGTMVGSFWVS